jgi:enolase
MSTIARLHALEILDSRGRPTIRATCELGSGVHGAAAVPSGASTGTAEALELRDGDPKRYCGLGCRRAVANINGELNDALSQREFASQADLDEVMIALDGTPNKARLGANAILAVSIAFARASALEQGIPLYRYFANMIGQAPASLPRPMINLYSGGKHAGGQVAIQDVQILPVAATTIDDILATAYDVFQAAAKMAQDQFQMRLLRADEGGLAPAFASTPAMIEAAVAAIRAAGREPAWERGREPGREPGRDVALTVDVAASHFYSAGRYRLEDETLSGTEMLDRLKDWLNRYPIVSLEDGLQEEDWAHWQLLCAQAGTQALILGDDLLCTNPDRIRLAIERKAANALLLKVNQIGSLTEAAEANRLARTADWRVVVSARSGETEDDWLADLAVGWSSDYIKVGSITQSERLAKYNRLLQIERETGLPVATRA